MTQNKEEKLVTEAKMKAEIYVKNNYEGIKEVTIPKDGYFFYPDDLGGISINGYVNGNKNLTFSVDFQTNDNQLGAVGSVMEIGEFPQRKEECENKDCD